MAQFHTSAKCVSYYLDSKATQRLMNTFGSHLQGLTQQEKYELVTAIALHLWGQCDDETEPEEDEFADLFEQDSSEMDLIDATENHLMPEISGQVKQALILLQYETPESLSLLLPAICEYARDDDR